MMIVKVCILCFIIVALVLFYTSQLQPVVSHFESDNFILNITQPSNVHMRVGNDSTDVFVSSCLPAS